jgi:GT2 family glycosyltransferase
LPNLSLGTPADLHVRGHNDKHRFALATGTLHLRSGGAVTFDTFMNGVTVERWRQLCGLTDFNFTIFGSGRVTLRFGLHKLGCAHAWLAEHEVDLAESPEIPLKFWPSLSTGMLYVGVEALETATITGGHFSTRAAPARDVKLGLVITHFNRKDMLLPALQSLTTALDAAPEWQGRISIVVVDNSQNVTPAESCGVTVIPNKNLGGSGGFTRGLLHCQDSGFSHCLFMDDDASSNLEAIRRAYMLLAFSKDDRTAIAGSQLRASSPWQLYEAGAAFQDGVWMPRKHLLDMRDIVSLLVAEREDAGFNYGGWWFFAFSIAAVQHYPFPFFVRGDDVQFSLQNQFRLVTANGVYTFGDDFANRETPMTRYLAARATLTLMLLNSQSGFPAYANWLFKWFVGCLYSYNYASARAILLALTHVSARGPTLFTDHMDMAAIRAEIAGFGAAEKMLPFETIDFVVLQREYQEPWWRGIVRRLTLNGFLIPDALLKPSKCFQFKNFEAAFYDVFRHREIVYYNEQTNTGYVARHDKAQFFGLLWQFCRAVIAFGRLLPRLRATFRAKLPEMTSEAFWRGVYAEDAPAQQKLAAE